jgi:hypothetical protein
MSKRGIGPILGMIVSSLAGGIINSRKDRNAATPPAAGVLRDVGITAVGVTSASLALQSQGIIDCTTYHLDQTYCNAAHGVLLIVGFIMYWIGIGQKDKNPKTPPTP